MILFVVWFLYDVFFFKQKTAYEMRNSDWSSDVCSSDLHAGKNHRPEHSDGDTMLVGDMQEERPEIEDGGRPSGKARLAEEEEADCDGERDSAVGIAVGRGKQRQDAGQKGAPAVIDSEVDGRRGPPDRDRNRATAGRAEERRAGKGRGR